MPRTSAVGVHSSQTRSMASCSSKASCSVMPRRSQSRSDCGCNPCPTALVVMALTALEAAQSFAVRSAERLWMSARSCAAFSVVATPGTR